MRQTLVNCETAQEAEFICRVISSTFMPKFLYSEGNKVIHEDISFENDFLVGLIRGAKESYKILVINKGNNDASKIETNTV